MAKATETKSKESNSNLVKVNIITTKQFEIHDITEKVKSVVKKSGVQSGVVVVFNPHTTSSIRINHNEPLLMQDIMKAVYRFAPIDINYNHDLFEVREQVAMNERSNGHSHVKAFLFGSSESLIIDDGQLLLGTKQSIFFVEFDGGRNRDYYIKILKN